MRDAFLSLSRCLESDDALRSRCRASIEELSESGSSEQSAESLELSASSLLFGSCGWRILIFFGASSSCKSNRIEPKHRIIVSAFGSKRPSAPTVDLDNV